MSYLILNNECVASTNEVLKGGETVRIAWLKTETGLCNAVYAKASNAKKWRLDAINAELAVLHSIKGIYKDFYAGV